RVSVEILTESFLLSKRHLPPWRAFVMNRKQQCVPQSLSAHRANHPMHAHLPLHESKSGAENVGPDFWHLSYLRQQDRQADWQDDPRALECGKPQPLE